MSLSGRVVRGRENTKEIVPRRDLRRIEAGLLGLFDDFGDRGAASVNPRGDGAWPGFPADETGPNAMKRSGIDARRG
jgi:hypothetical protein